MSSKVHVPFKTMETKKEEIDSWLKSNAGNGSARYGGREGVINHWLNGEDYCYYNQVSNEFESLDAIVVFREDRTATEFALRFA
jgi:hypothetical protein